MLTLSSPSSASLGSQHRNPPGPSRLSEWTPRREREREQSFFFAKQKEHNKKEWTKSVSKRRPQTGDTITNNVTQQAAHRSKNRTPHPVCSETILFTFTTYTRQHIWQIRTHKLREKLLETSALLVVTNICWSNIWQTCLTRYWGLTGQWRAYCEHCETLWMKAVFWTLSKENAFSKHKCAVGNVLLQTKQNQKTLSQGWRPSLLGWRRSLDNQKALS